MYPEKAVHRPDVCIISLIVCLYRVLGFQYLVERTLDGSAVYDIPHPQDIHLVPFYGK